MGPALLRIDDRLLHGQVALGWVIALGSKLIVLANDEVAGDAWLAEIYAGAAPADVRIEILTLKETAGRFGEFCDESLAAIVLVKTAEDALDLVEMGAMTETVNVGGMHFEQGKRRLLPYLYVNERDEIALRRLLGLGVKIEAQDVPGGKSHDLAALLEQVGG